MKKSDLGDGKISAYYPAREDVRPEENRHIHAVAPYTSGDGWLRILEFLPDGRTIKVRTYSPLFGISSLTKHLAHRTGTCDRFDMVIE